MLSRMARLILDYCIEARKGDEVVIEGGYEAYPLIKELWKYCVSRGVYPYLLIHDEVLDEIFLKYATKELLAHRPKLEELVVESVDAVINIISALLTSDGSS